MSDQFLTAGFAAPVRDAQATFRALLDAMARPGTIANLPTPAEPPPAPLCPAGAAAALALCDVDTPVWLEGGLAKGGVPAWLRFHCGCPIVPEAASAAFAFGEDAAPDMQALDEGSDLYPDRSTTLVLHVASLSAGALLRLTGPGIEEATQIRVAGLCADFVAQRAENRKKYPRGVDCILVAGKQALCLPRSTIVEAG